MYPQFPCTQVIKKRDEGTRRGEQTNANGSSTTRKRERTTKSKWSELAGI